MSDVKKLFPYLMDIDESEENASSETQYYINILRTYDGFPRFASWNWPAFLFGAGWLLYRKMYVYGVIALTVSVFVSYYSNLAYLLIPSCIFFGIFGNAIYRHDLEKRVNNNSTRKGTSSLIAFVYAVVFDVFLEFKR